MTVLTHGLLHSFDQSTTDVSTALTMPPVIYTSEEFLEFGARGRVADPCVARTLAELEPHVVEELFVGAVAVDLLRGERVLPQLVDDRSGRGDQARDVGGAGRTDLAGFAAERGGRLGVGLPARRSRGSRSG